MFSLRTKKHPVGNQLENSKKKTTMFPLSISSEVTVFAQPPCIFSSKKMKLGTNYDERRKKIPLHPSGEKSLPLVGKIPPPCPVKVSLLLRRKYPSPSPFSI